MALPWLVAAGAAALLGAKGHSNAKKTNEKAELIHQSAQSIYDEAKKSLENEQKRTEASLLRLGNTKQNVFEGSFKQFEKAYKRTKDVKIKQSVGLNEISKFAIDEQSVLQMQKLSDVYQSSLKSGAAGAAAGTIMALAASGALPFVTGALSAAGTALAIGEIGIATSLAGSALSFGLSASPLAFVAAPVVLFTGFSASKKADKNLEKARSIYAQAEAAVEKMKTSETKCKAIAERAKMFDGLLAELDEMFSGCANLLDAVTRAKTDYFKTETLSEDQLDDTEIKLVAVTRSLAGAVKAVLDTPILGSDGSLSTESKSTYHKIKGQLPAFSQSVASIEGTDYAVGGTHSASGTAAKALRIWGILTAGLALVYCAYLLGSWLVSSLISSFKLSTFTFVTNIVVISTYIVSKFFISNDTKNSVLKWVRNLISLALAVNMGFLLYYMCRSWIHADYFWWKDIASFIVSGVLFGITDEKQSPGIFKQVICEFLGLCVLLSLAPLVFLFSSWLFSFNISIVITEIVVEFFVIAILF